MDPVLTVLVALAVPVLLAVIPAVAWLLTGRICRVGLLLLGWFAVVIGLGLLSERPRAELALLYLPVSAAILISGARRAQQKIHGALLAVVITLTAGITCVCAPFTWYAIGSQPFQPNANEVLPLPDDLQATIDDHPRPDCGIGACAMAITVTSRTGQPPSEVADQVRHHLTARGWPLDATGWSCRPLGLLLDQRTLCVGLRERDGQVQIALDGSRAFA